MKRLRGEDVDDVQPDRQVCKPRQALQGADLTKDEADKGEDQLCNDN